MMVSFNSIALFVVGASAGVIISPPAFNCLNDVHVKCFDFKTLVEGWKGDLPGAIPMLVCFTILRISA
jgi:hypothetical protein